MAQWTDLPFDEKLFQNVDETVLTKAQAALENAFVNEAGGHSRFPGSAAFANLSGTRTYLHDWRGDLVAATDEGRVYRIDEAGNATDVTGVPIKGGRRVVFTKTEDELAMAAGGPIIRLASGLTEVLSEDAPESTHVAFIGGYLVAIEPYSGRFYYSEAGLYRDWDPLDLFTAEGRPDDLIAAIVTPYDELLLAGDDSIEQFEQLTGGSVPFFRRWSNGQGVFAPYTMATTDIGTWALNKDREYMRFAGQAGRVESDDIGMVLEKIDDWREAWAARVHVKGQKFVVLQAPFATNPYGTQGVTALLDYRARRWSSLYDWDAEISAPARWRPWSYHQVWGRHFVGVPGGVEELKLDAYGAGDGGIQRVLGRTAHIDQWGASRIDNFSLRLKRGLAGSNDNRPGKIAVRANRDNLGFGPWSYRDFGRHGDRDMTVEFGGFGMADTWQFEYSVTEAVNVEFVKARALVERLRR